MKQEEFDQLIQAQFANDVVNPPAHVEEAVFNTLSASTRKRKYFGWFISLIIVGFTSIGAWQFAKQSEPIEAMNPSNNLPVVVDDPSIDPSIDPMNRELQVPSDVNASLGSIEEPDEAIDEKEFMTIHPQGSRNAEPSGLTSDAQGQILPPGSSLESISLLPAETIESNALNDEVELEQKDKETWMLPAKVKVKH